MVAGTQSTTTTEMSPNTFDFTMLAANSLAQSILTMKNELWGALDFTTESCDMLNDSSGLQLAIFF